MQDIKKQIIKCIIGGASTMAGFIFVDKLFKTIRDHNSSSSEE